MIERPDDKLKERINKAIANIRFIATRVKRASVLQATQKAEITVTLLNEFRQYVNALMANDQATMRNMPFRHDQETLTKIVNATLQADDVYNMLARTNKKKYEDEHRQVWSLLENLHAFIEKQIKKGGGNA
jgi:hypothetical protein